MAGMGPAPKPDAQRRRSNSPTFAFTAVPRAGRGGEPPPDLPSWLKVSASTTSAWAEAWSKPQAALWDQSGFTLWRWAMLLERIVNDPDVGVSAHTQIQAIEDRHGFTPAAMLKLRWVLVDDATPAVTGTAKPRRAKSAKQQTAGLASRLRMVPPLPDPPPPAPVKRSPRRPAKQAAPPPPVAKRVRKPKGS